MENSKETPKEKAKERPTEAPKKKTQVNPNAKSKTEDKTCPGQELTGAIAGAAGPQTMFLR